MQVILGFADAICQAPNPLWGHQTLKSLFEIAPPGVLGGDRQPPDIDDAVRPQCALTATGERVHGWRAADFAYQI